MALRVRRMSAAQETDLRWIVEASILHSLLLVDAKGAEGVEVGCVNLAGDAEGEH